MMQQIAHSSLFIIFGAAVLVALIALTMRAVIRRDKAMANTSVDKPEQVEAYQKRWRSAA